MKTSFYILSFAFFILGILGLFDIEVWIRNRGWITLSLKESVIYLIISILTFLFTKYFIKED